ncbi:MAG: hypothetical protein A2Z96_07075 [Spirochaetes bacterium GWB1_48_6]|nr:MAG: hypothetical protein A2Z96_07075 [Spirochaetes bacterium GWB1_48_6]
MPTTPAVPETDINKKKHPTQGRLFKIAMVVVLSLILITFLMPSAGKFVESSNQADFGSYDGTPITYTQENFFGRQVNAFSDYYSQYGANDQMVYQIYSEAFRSAAVQTGLEKEAAAAGILITESRVLDQLVQNPRFFEDGSFSLDLYKAVSPAEKLQITKDSRQDLLVRQYAMDLLQGSQISDKDLEYVASLEYPQRKISFVTFSDADYPEAEVVSYGQKNSKLFKTISLARISVANEGDAQRVLDEITKGEKPFEALAQAYSTDTLAQAGGALDWRSYYELQADFENVADFDQLFTLAKGATSGKIKTVFGYSVYKLVDGPTEPDFTQAALKEKVKTYLLRNDRGLVEDYLKTQAQTFITSATGTLEKAAASTGKKLESSDFFPVNYGNLSFATTLDKAAPGTAVASLGSNEDFYKAVFAMEKGKISAPVNAGSSVVVFQVVDEKTSGDAVDEAKKSAIRSELFKDRSEALENTILRSPKFKDEFQKGFTTYINPQGNN